MKSPAKLATDLLALLALTQTTMGSLADHFPWKDPFGSHATPSGFQAKCEATATFHATQHVIHEIHEPPPIGLSPWIDAVKYFFGGRPFPGSWDGFDKGGINRDVIKMEYSDLPAAVKAWIVTQDEKESDGKWLFGVYEKPHVGEKVTGTANVVFASEDKPRLREEDLVVLFAAGAVYEILPLWVAGGSRCETDLADLTKYSPEPKDGGVVAWVVERTAPDLGSKDRGITFKVKAQVVKALEGSDEGTRSIMMQKVAVQPADTSTAVETLHPTDGSSFVKDEL